MATPKRKLKVGGEAGFEGLMPVIKAKVEYESECLYNLEGTYYIVNKQSGKYLDVDGESQENGANVHQWAFTGGDNEQWRFVDAGDGTYYIEAKCSGKVLDVDGGSTENGANVRQWSRHGGHNQKWKLLKSDD